jgi:DNA adenine methylase
MNTLSLVRWAGGKGKQLNDLLPLVPQTKIYVEPFGGGCSVLLNRERSEVEVYNDLDGALVNLFEVLRDDEQGTEFARLVGLTPYSREVFEGCLSFEGIADPVRRAAAFYTVLNQSISGKRLASKGDWARGRTDNLADRWFHRQEGLNAIHTRIRNVQIECRDALDILQEWDTPDTTFYCDPPYILESRRGKRYYAVEPGDEYHKELVDVLLRVRGNVVLSGYNHPTYYRLVEEGGWWTDLYGANATMAVVQAGESKSKDRSDRRVEIVYRNPQACEVGVKRPLFDHGTFGDAARTERTRESYEETRIS